jgi:hypothetical protein
VVNDDASPSRIKWWWGARAGGTAEEAAGKGGQGGETWGETPRLAATAAKFLSCFGFVGGANGNAYLDTEDGQMDVRRESRGEGCGPVLNDIIFGGGEGGARAGTWLLSRVPTPLGWGGSACWDGQGQWQGAGSPAREGGGGGARIGVRRRKGPPEWENLVFSGGGVKVLAFPPALGILARTFGDTGQVFM